MYTHTYMYSLNTYLSIFFSIWIYISITMKMLNISEICSILSSQSLYANLSQTLVHTHNRTHYGVDGLVPVWPGALLWRLASPRWVVSPPPPLVPWCSLLLESSMGQGSATDHYLALRPWGSGRGCKQQAVICVLADCTSNVQQCANKNKLLWALASAPCWAGCVMIWSDRVNAESN